MNNIRILHLVAFAALCLFGLKTAGLVLSGGYVLTGAAPASAQATAPAASQERDPAYDFTPVSAVPRDNSQETQAPEDPSGETSTRSAPRKPSEEREQSAKEDIGTNKSEQAILEGLSNRRKALDARERDLEMRENLLKAAEKRVQQRIAELKKIEARIESTLQKRDDRREAQYEKLVKMYSDMKPDDAAKIFNRLDMDTLTGLVTHMKARVMAEILAEMAPEAAERLTLEIANRGLLKDRPGAELPKIGNQQPD